MATDGKEYRLKIRSDGKVMYYCEDGRFWSLRQNRQAKPKHFSTRKEAQGVYLAWAYKYIATSGEWHPVIEEV